MKTKLLLIILISTSVLAQNITNTLGTSGTFTIKDNSNSYLTLNQFNGNINLFRNLNIGNSLNSTLTTGVITKNGVRFMHNYQAPATDGFNTFIGLLSGNFTMAGSLYNASYNTGVGYGTLSSISLGFGNSAFGYQSLFSNAEGYDNTAIGILSLTSNTSGSENTAVGNGSLANNTTGYNNTAIGSVALNSNTTGYENTAVGINCLLLNNGFRNTAVGTESLLQNSNGNYNSALGYQSLKTNSNGINNCAFGYQSLLNNSTGNENSAFGHSSLYSNTLGFSNSAFGQRSLLSNTTGSSNVAIGNISLGNNSIGSSNTAIGVSSLSQNIDGDNNTAVGRLSLSNNKGNNNTAIGFTSGALIITGSNLTCIGYQANPTSSSATDQITLGNGFITSLRCNVTTITSLSDMRDKKNIKDLSLGLDFLMKVKPRMFNWDKREWYEDNTTDGSKMQETPTAGFIAQELDSVQINDNAEWLNLVLKDNPEKLEATPGNLLPIMVKAIQELKEENEELKKSVKSGNERMAQIEKLLLELKSKGNNIPEIKSVEK
jgi:hypothetical protein